MSPARSPHRPTAGSRPRVPGHAQSGNGQQNLPNAGNYIARHYDVVVRTRRFKDSWDRLDRAANHLAAIRDEWAGMLADKGFSTFARYDKDSGWFIASGVLTEAAAKRVRENNLSLELGELAYQLRAALDGLICETIAHTQGAEPPADASRIEFPILNGKKRDFNKCAFLKYPFPEKLIIWLQSIQPDTAVKPEGDQDRGLNVTLEDIHNLARLDRHRRLRILVAVPTKLKFGFTTDPVSKIIARERIDTFNLFSGQLEFLRFRVETADGSMVKKGSLQTDLTLEILAEDVEPYENRDIGTQLMRFLTAVERVIERFEEEFN
jgi:hypothetical protein